MTKKYHPHVIVHLTKDEKAHVDKLARQNEMSTSAFVKYYLSPVLSVDETMPNIPFEFEPEERNIRIELHVSEREINTIRANAGARTIASYVREAALNGSKVIKVEVYDDDIVDLEHRIQPKLNSLFGVVRALEMQKQLHESQYNKIIDTLNSILQEIRKLSQIKRKERYSIRQTRLRELRKQCDYAMKTEKDRLACLDNGDIAQDDEYI